MVSSTNTWFTSDRHFGHKNVIRHCNRPFESVEEMDEILIQRHNERVKPGDVFYDLGDFAFADHTPYLQRLNGQGHLVPGNHDHTNRLKKAVGWNKIEKLMHVKLGDIQIVLCHYAMRTWRNSHHGAIHLYGHSHGNLPGDSQSCDVGVDCWDFYPVSIEEIRERLADPYRCAPRWEPDHHQARKVA